MPNLKFKIGGLEYSPPEGTRFDDFAAMAKMDSLDASEFERRCNRLYHVLSSNDISFAGSGESKRTDPLPLIISAKEWRGLKEGLTQRARLFNALAEDMYGEQTLWKTGKLPPALLFANPDFLSVAWKVKPAYGIFIHLMGSDLIRDADGNFRVTEDYLQVPDGLGRALENRIGVSRAFPELFRKLYTERLAGFFKTLLDCLNLLQKEQNIEGVVAMLASAPNSERRAEDAVLARYLGIPLVENDDLAVRRMQVYMKTLVGLKKIGTLFRRVEDTACDPLELRVDTGEGAVGLISTIRAGNAAMANFLGSGALEHSIFNPFLPEVCKTLLNEELLLPSVETLWCADSKSKDRIFDEPEKWKFRKIFGKENFKTYKDLTVTGKLALMQAVEKEPEKYVAVEATEGSTAPVYRNKNWVTANVKMRFFCVNTPSETIAMPGGYGTYQIPSAPGEPVQTGEKDIWVLAGHPVATFSLLAPAESVVTPTRAGGDLPSRAAENLYHLGRALAATNMMSRVARILAERLSDESWPEMPEIPWLLKSIHSTEGDPENALRYFVLRKDCSDGLQIPLKQIRDLSVQLRDRISDDLWNYLSSFGSAKMPDGTGAAAVIPYLTSVLTDSAAVSGVMAESMTRGHEWRFQEIGRRIERGIRLLRLLESMLVDVPADESLKLLLLQALLEVGDGTMTYHRRYGGRLQTVPVLDLLLCDESNPRSVAYQVLRLCEEAKHLPGDASVDSIFLPLDRELLRLQTELRLADVKSLSLEENARRPGLERLISTSIASFEKAAELINRHYLNHAPRAGIVHALATEV